MFSHFFLDEELEIVEIGESVTLAEDLGEISGLALNSAAEYLALALENSEVWVLRLSWKKTQEICPKKVVENGFKSSTKFSNKICISEVSHFATLEGHRSVVTGLHYIGTIFPPNEVS